MRHSNCFWSLCLCASVVCLLPSSAGAQDKVDALLTQLRTGNATAKVTAAIKLAELGPEAAAAAPELVKALQTKNEDVRLNAALALGKIGKAAVPEISKVLTNENVDVRFYAISALGWIGPDAGDSAPLIIKALADKNDNIRRKAVYTLGRIAPRPEAAIPVLIKAFADGSAEVRQAAGEAVGKLGVAAVPALRSALKDDGAGVRLQAARALGEVGADAKEAVTDLAALLVDKEKGIPLEASNALAKIGKASIPVLVETLKNADINARGLAVDTLAKIGAPAVPVLVDALGANWVDVRSQAARQLGLLRVSDKMVVIGLAHTLKDENAMVRRTAAQALQNLGPGAHLAAPALLATLRDPDAAVRHHVLLALTTVRGDAKEMVPALVELLKDESPQIRQSAVRILSGYGAPALPHMLVALKDVDAGVRQQALFGLQAIPGDIKEALPALLPMLGDNNINTRRITILLLGRAGEEAVPHLREALKDPAPNLRWTAASSLGNLGPAAKKAIPELIDLAVGDTNITVRRMSMFAVVRIQPEEVGPLFDKIKKHPDDKIRQSAYQIFNFNKQIPAKVAVPILVDGLKDKIARIRQVCALNLGRFGPAAKSAIEPLTAALNDPDPQVRTLAQSALRQIQGK